MQRFGEKIKKKIVVYIFFNFVDSTDFLKGLVHLCLDWISMKMVRIGTAILCKDIYVAFNSNESLLVIVSIIYSLFLEETLSRSYLKCISVNVFQIQHVS